jgi:hypothetical protein
MLSSILSLVRNDKAANEFDLHESLVTVRITGLDLEVGGQGVLQKRFTSEEIIGLLRRAEIELSKGSSNSTPRRDCRFPPESLARDQLQARISQMTLFALACDLRKTLEKLGCSANSCHAHGGTQWVTAKAGICGSVSTAV